MKIGLASFLSCLALLLGLYTTTGTASAHTASHPFINVVSGLQRLGNCLVFQLEGGGFTPDHHVDLFASASGGASIDPNRVRANGNGRFFVTATACANQQFSNCGSFIESTNFCGFNLPQNDFCGFDGFQGSQCFIGSAMKSLAGGPGGNLNFCPPDAPCFGSPGSGTGGNQGSDTGGNQGSGTGSNQGSDTGGNQGPNNQDMPHGGQTGCGQNQLECCMLGSISPQCQNNGRGTFCDRNPDQCNHGGQTGCDQNQFKCCQSNQNFQDCQNNGRGTFCDRNPDQCNQNHRPFRFHRVPVFDFCRFHQRERFSFCFRFFPQEFSIQIGITAVDEHTGRRAHAFVSIG